MDAESIAWSSGESEPNESDGVRDVTGASKTADDIDIDIENNSDIRYDSSFYPSVKDFTGLSGIRDTIVVPDDTPLGYFEIFFNSILLEMITTQTNLYQEQNPEPLRMNMKPWKLLTVDELRIFLGLTINMGHVRKGSLESYWSTDPLLATPLFGNIMPRNRYLQILRFLHFANNEEIENHSLKKVKPVIDDLRKKFSNTILPGQNLCIDESLVLWKGRLKFKQYLPLKRNRFGIKLFELVDCETGFLIDFIVYTGSDTDYEKFGLGISGDIVAHFLKPYFNKGHVIYVDNWYSSPQLAEFLHDHNTGMCGTVRKNRKCMPNLGTKLNRGEIQVAHNDVWLVMKWMDKKEVYMITTVHEVGFCLTGKKHWRTGEDIMKPVCVHEYNQNMGGIDNIDRQLSLTETIRKSMKWYKKFFFHLVDLSLTNAHVLYNQSTERKLSFPEFRLAVVKELLKLGADKHSYSVESSNLRLTGRHFPIRIENEDSSKIIQRQCKLCAMSKIRRRSSYKCNICCEALCITPCFETYHTKPKLP